MRTLQAETMKVVLPNSARTEATRIAEREGISLADFVMLAVVEKLTRCDMNRVIGKPVRIV